MAKQEKRRYADRRQYLIAAVHKRRKKIRQMALEYKGGRCERCGYDRCSEALEFHHISSSVKDFSVSSRGYTRSWKRVKEELDKCILFCANCHREIHVQVSSSCRKLQDVNRASQGNPERSEREKASKFRELRLDKKRRLQGVLSLSKDDPEPSPERNVGEGAETRHSLPNSVKDMVKV